MLYLPKPGDIGLTSSRAWTGRAVRSLQALIDDDTIVTHTFLVLYDGFIIEAQPGGAKFNRLDKYPDAQFTDVELTDAERYNICIEGISMHGVGYSWLDYLALGLTHFKIFPADFVRRRVAKSDKLMCSQLCAEAYRRAGVDLFLDSRHPMDVTPGDLGRLAAARATLTTGW